jgi:polyferredoxin
MDYGKALGKIPLVVEGPKTSPSYHWRRRALQGAIIILAILIPVTGLFRIDPVEGAFVVLGRQVWFADFFLVVGLWMAVSSGLVTTYSTLGTAFCGWACPQNSLSEWGNRMTQKLLGKRAAVSLTGEKMRVSAGKNKWRNWVVLGGSFTVVAMFFALIPLFYFYPPSAVWSFVTFQEDARLAGSVHWIYTVFVLIILLDIAFIRHFFCRFMCIYRVWQHSFKTKETLHVAYDASHAEECMKCNFCVTTCFVGIDPRKTETYDSCVNCGECIDACGAIRAPKGGTSLLRFELGQRHGQASQRFRNSVGSLLGRVRWTIPFFVMGLGMFIWGLWTYQPYHVTAGRTDNSPLDYRIDVSNKRYQAETVTIAIEGLPAGAYTLQNSQVHFASAGRKDILMHINPTLPPGLLPILVHVRSDDGWTDVFRLYHFVPKV